MIFLILIAGEVVNGKFLFFWDGLFEKLFPHSGIGLMLDQDWACFHKESVECRYRSLNFQGLSIAEDDLRKH